VKYKLNVKIVIVKNNSLGQIKWEQMVFLGNPEFGCELEPIDFVKFAEACGARGYNIKRPEECASVFDEAFSYDGPVLIEAEVDPNEPPMPGKISFEQAKHFGESLLKGNPDRMDIAITASKTRLKQMI
jgi:pyruvate dehydrogenase (quinone)